MLAVMNSSAAWPSPCINVCRMDAARHLCLGCQRTIDEIAGWSRMDDAAKREVWSRIEWRRACGDDSARIAQA